MMFWADWIQIDLTVAWKWKQTWSKRSVLKKKKKFRGQKFKPVFRVFAWKHEIFTKASWFYQAGIIMAFIFAGPLSSAGTPLLWIHLSSTPSIEIGSSKVTSLTSVKVSSTSSTEKHENCSAVHVHCIQMANGSCVSYCVYVDKNYNGIDKCLSKFFTLRPKQYL